MIRPGRLGVERARRVGQRLGFEPGSRARSSSSARSLRRWLVCVHAALHVGQFGIGCAGRARLVFDVPEVEVGAMLEGNEAQP